MTRRIALAILITVWAILIAGGSAAYLAVRWALIEQFDQSLVAKAASVPELARLSFTTGPAAGGAVTRPVLPAQGAYADRYVIKSDNGQTLSPPGGGLALSNVELLTASFSTLADGTRMRSVTLHGSARGADGGALAVTIHYQASAISLDRQLDRIGLGFAIFGPLAGLLTAFVAVRVSRSALRPLYETAQVIGTIDSRNLHQRIDGASLPPEMLPVAQHLNEMLERIERAYAQRHQFLADASHELRTPVAALVTTAEVSLRHPRQAESYRAALESCLADARLLRKLVERLMEQCRADTLTHDEQAVELDAAALLNQCADMARTLAAERGVRLERHLPVSLTIKTQPQRLGSVVTNLLSNAVEYNRAAGLVELRAQVMGEQVEVVVRDTGVGIAAEHLPHLFEPFYRADRARSGEAGHLGLGLSLVQAHVAALGGTIEVSSEIGVGTSFRVVLPLGRGADIAVAAGES